MKRIALYGLLFILLAFFGCSKRDNGNLTPERHEYVVLPGKQIIEITDTLKNGFVNTYYNVVDGNSLVFKALYSAEQYENILDDEHTEILWFEIDSQMVDFYYENDSLPLTKAYFIMYGAWVPSTPFTFNSGYLYGAKISEEYWDVTVDIDSDVSTTQKIEVKFSELFRIEK